MPWSQAAANIAWNSSWKADHLTHFLKRLKTNKQKVNKKIRLEWPGEKTFSKLRILNVNLQMLASGTGNEEQIRFLREKPILRSLKLTRLLTSFSLRTGVAPFCIFIFCFTVWFWILAPLPTFFIHNSSLTDKIEKLLKELETYWCLGYSAEIKSGLRSRSYSYFIICKGKSFYQERLHGQHRCLSEST